MSGHDDGWQGTAQGGARQLPPLLHGVRVIEHAQNGAAPYAGRILADLGADVIKIESPEGDVARRVGASSSGVSGLFLHANAGKRSMTLDCTTEAGRELLTTLLERADCVIADETSVLVDAPGLRPAMRSGGVIVFITPFGLDCSQPRPVTGARALFHAGGEGFMTPRGAPLTAPPVAPSANVAWFDAGVAGAYAALLGLHCRDALPSTPQAEEPHVFDIAIRDVQVALCRQDICTFVNEGHIEDRAASHSPSMGMQLGCSDGEVTLHLADHHWPGWCGLIDREELATDPRFLTRETRAQHLETVVDELERWTRTRTRAEVQDQTQPIGLPVAAILSPSEVLSDDQLAHRSFFVQLSDSPSTVVGSALPFVARDGARWYPAHLPPSLGQHTSEISAEVGHRSSVLAIMNHNGGVA